MTEIWKSIEGYEDAYEVSNLGRVKSFAKKTVFGKTYQSKVLTLTNAKGYLKVGLRDSNCNQKNHFVHRLVAIAFLCNSEHKPQVNHRDGIKSNNAFHNLEWATSKENMRHAFDKGLAKGMFGKENHQSKLNVKQVKEVKNLLAKKTLTQLQIAKLFGVSKSAISHISAGNSWSKI